MEKCTGCRSCENACSYHLKGYFSPVLSAVRVYWDGGNGRMELSIEKKLCDLCNDEEVPLCVKYCAPHALVASKRV